MNKACFEVKGLVKIMCLGVRMWMTKQYNYPQQNDPFIMPPSCESLESQCAAFSNWNHSIDGVHDQ